MKNDECEQVYGKVILENGILWNKGLHVLDKALKIRSCKDFSGQHLTFLTEEWFPSWIMIAAEVLSER